MQVWIKTQVQKVRCQNKSNPLTWPVSRTEAIQGVRLRSSCPQVSLPLGPCPSIPVPLACCQCCLLTLYRGRQKEGSYTLPNRATTRFAGSFGHIICEVIFFVCVQSDLILILYVVRMERHFICVLAELFLCILYGFSLFLFSFLNYA